ncbi:MAG: LCP family protein [Actinomycetes bacterium]
MASGTILALALAAGLGGHYTTSLLRNVKASTDGNFTGIGSPEPGAPINILVMGSDTRSGKNSKGHGDPNIISGARSDTTILLHVSGDRTRVTAVSIPRDSQVQIASCKTPSGGTSGNYVGNFNEAFELGGPGCTAKTVQELTGIPINHYVVADFVGFKNVVQALGGVEVCLTKPVNDSYSHLNLPAGKSTVTGEQALAFVRARHNLGDGSDISRIGRQQEFISSAIRKATSAGVLTNPTQLYDVLAAVTGSLTTDPGLASADALMNLAVNVSDVSPGKITFVTVPWVANPDGATVSWDPAQAPQLWDAIKNDRQWPPATSAKPSAGTGTSGTTTDSTAKPRTAAESVCSN